MYLGGNNTRIEKSLAVAVILLFFSMSVIPSTGTTDVKQIAMPTVKGDTLYVGGNGTGNYTKIQDAIDNASKGDTVYVYNGTYYENVKVYKSINLIGEDRDTTTIGREGGISCSISADWVNISGFTIKNSWDRGDGIVIESSFNTITGNNIVDNIYGIFFSVSPHDENNNISGNIISSNRIGIHLWHDDDNTISSNTIINNTEFGIILWYSDENEISRNSISGNYVGISLVYSQDNIITGNTIKNNKFGIELFDSSGNFILRNNITNNQLGINLTNYAFGTVNGIVKENNFIENDQSVDYNYFLNRWIGNYWDDWDSLLPRPVKSKCVFVLLSGLLSEIFKEYVEISIPWVQFDWHPAQEPYDIGV